MSRAKWNRCLIDEDPNAYEVMPDGSVRRGLRFLYSDQDIEMIRQGYKCSECGEVQEHAFPDACLLCEFPMKEQQAQNFAERFAGHRDTGGLIDWDAEEEHLERQRHERNRSLGLTNRIWVP